MSLRPDDARARRPPGADRLARVLRAGLRFTEQARGTGAPTDEDASPIVRSLPTELWNEIMVHLANADDACAAATTVPQLCGTLKVLLGRFNTGPGLLDVCNRAEFWKRACEYRGWTYDSMRYVPPIDGWGDKNGLARWREQYLLFCSTAHGLTNQLYLALYSKLVGEACTRFGDMYEEEYGAAHGQGDQLASFPALYELQHIRTKAERDSPGEELRKLYNDEEPDNRLNMQYNPSSPMYSPASPPHSDYDEEDASPARLPAGMRDNGANATFGSIVNTVGACANWAMIVALDYGVADDGGDTFAFRPTPSHVLYLVSMIRNVAMVAAKHCVRIYENRPTSRDPSSVQAWQAHSHRYNQAVDEFRKIVTKPSDGVWPADREVPQKRWRLSLSFNGNVKVEEESSSFTL